jgi:general secretion pathway protein N
MIDLLRRNPLIAALAVVCLVLASIVAIELATIGRGSPAAAPRKVAASEAKLLPPVAAVAPEAAYPETASRPLWIPTRRPAPPAVVQQASFQRGQFTLQGVIVAGGTRIAMLRDKTSGRIHRVEQGREVNGLQVAEVDNDKVVLAAGGDREVVELRVTKGAGAGTPAAAAAPGAPQPVAATAPSTQGPFGPAARPPTAPTTPAGPQGALAGGQMGPLPATTGPATSARPPGVPNPAARTMPQSQPAPPMTPEELLARRRIRRQTSE